MKQYPHLSSPIQIGSVTLRNRIFMAPMDTGFGNNAWGGFTEAGVEYFVRRAQGGFGLLFSGGTAPDNQVDAAESILDHQEEFIRTGREMNRRIEGYGSRMFMQLSMGVGRNGALKTPSPLPALGNPAVTTTELTVDEIRAKVHLMGQGARLCQEAGYAGVDIHALHWGHLLDSFALSLMNHREDEYGGFLENRLRIVKEIREEIAAQCGPDFPVSIRFAVRSMMKGFDQASFDGSDEAGRTLEEAVEIARLLEQYGYNAISTDAGTLDAFYYAMPPSYVEKGYTLKNLRAIKAAVSIPILAGARMADPDMTEQAIADGIIDAAVVGRQAIADPDYAGKIVAGQREQVRTCIGCNQGCIWGYFTTGQVGCAVNPEVGREGAGGIPKAADRKKVIVVGGGLVGCEIAFGYAREGRSVTIVEALDDVLSVGDVPGMNKAMLLDAFNYYGTKLLTGTQLKAVRDEGAIVKCKDGAEETIPADSVIFSIGYRSVPSMAEELQDCGAKIVEIGDGHKVGNVLTCIRDAYEAMCGI